MFTLVVFTSSSVRRPPARSCARGRRGELRRRLRRARRDRAAEPARRADDRDPRRRAGSRPTSAWSAASRSCRARPQVGARADAEYPVLGLRPAVPPGHDVPARRHRDRLRLARTRSGTRSPLARTSPWSTSSPRRAATTGASPRRPTSAAGFYVEDGAFDAGAGRGPRPRPGRTSTLTVDRRARGHRRRSTWPACGRRSGRSARRSADARQPTIHHVALAPGVDADRAAAGLERALVANGMEAKSHASGPPRGRRRVVHAQLALLGVHGAGARGRRRRARRDQRPLGRRAAAADRRAARDRLPPRHGPAQLPARVVVHRADRDRRRDGARAPHRLQRHQDAADQPSWQGALHFVVPWTHLAIVFCGVYAAALLTTLAPAARASRVQPAQALRYE